MEREEMDHLFLREKMRMIEREGREIVICDIKKDNVKNELSCEQYHIRLGNEVHLTKHKMESMAKWHNVEDDALMGNNLFP